MKPRGMAQKGLLELGGRSDSDRAGDSATRQSVTGYHCDVQNVTICNRSLKQTAISHSLCEADFYAASACAGKLLGLAELFKELQYNVFSSSRDGFRLGKTHYPAQGTRRTQTYRNTMPCNTTVDTRETSICESSGHEDQHCRSLHETSGWIANTVAHEENLDFGILCGTTWYKMVTTEEWCQLRAFEQLFQSSRGVSILSFNS